MKKIILIISIIALVVIVGFLTVNGYLPKINKQIMPINLNEKSEIKSVEKTEEKVLEEKTKEQEDQSEEKKQEQTTKVENKTSNQNNKVSSAGKQSETKNKTKEETKKSSGTSNQQKQQNNSESGVVDPAGNNQPIEENYVVDKTPWEKAGVSEYDWYHKPVHNWMRVDYNVSSCGSVSNCESVCMKVAEELAYTENVSCIQVYTYSGNYLGEMLKKD